MRRLHSFSMQIANPSAQGNHRASAVETCSCPVGYAGTSCEVCSRNALQDLYSFSELSLNCFWVFQACVPGFRRVNGNLYNGVCAACHCHGHASQCHEVTGHCLVRPGLVWSSHITGDFSCKIKSYICSCVADADGDDLGILILDSRMFWVVFFKVRSSQFHQCANQSVRPNFLKARHHPMVIVLSGPVTTYIYCW